MLQLEEPTEYVHLIGYPWAAAKEVESSKPKISVIGTSDTMGVISNPDSLYVETISGLQREIID